MSTTTGESATHRVSDLISAHSFFKDFSPGHRSLLADAAAFEPFAMGGNIFREGEDADRFYLIVHGRVALETFVPRVGATTVQTIEAGGALGWSWLYPPYRWRFSARAIEPVEAVVLRAAGLRELTETDHDFGYELLRRVGRVMLDTLQETRRRLVEFYVRDLVE